MAEKTYQTTLLIRGDSKDAVRSVQLTREQLEQLTGVQQKNATMADKLSATYSSLGKVVATGLAAGVGVAALAMRKVVEETSASDAAMAQLNATLKSTGGVAGKSAAELAETASQLQQVTTYSDEAVLGAQSLLLTFKDIKGDNFDRTTRAVLDMSTALKKDLNSSALLAGKALNDPVKGLSALSKAGIQFTADQKEAIKALVEMGDKAGAQTIILRELESQFGGSAEAAAGTLGGALKQLENSFGELFEVSSKTSGGMVESINALKETISDPKFKEGIESLVQGLLKVVELSASAAAGIGNLTRVVAENAASRIGGPAVDDVARLESQAAHLTRFLTEMERVGQTAGSSYKNLKAELAEVEGKLKTYDTLFGKHATNVVDANKVIDGYVGSLVDGVMATERSIVATGKAATTTERFSLVVNKSAAATKGGTKATQEGIAAGLKSEDTLKKEAAASEKLAKEKQAMQDRIARVNAEFEKGHEYLDGLTRATREHIDALKFETAQLGLSERQQFINNELRKEGTAITKAEREELIRVAGAHYDAATAAEEQAQAEQDAAQASEQAWSDMRATLSNFLFEFARDGDDVFETVFNSFRAMVIKMAAEAASNQIILGVSSAFPGLGNLVGGVSAPGTGATSGGSTLLSGGISGLTNGITASGQALYESIGNIASNAGFTRFGDAAYTKGLNTTGLSMGLDLAGGFAGSFAGSKVFGETSGIGSTAGGIAGSILIPVPGLGAAIGSFVGSGLEKAFDKVFGQKNDGDNKGQTNFDLATGTNRASGIGKSFNQENVDAAENLGELLKEFADTIGGSSLAANITVGGKEGIKYGGEAFGTDTERFLQTALRDVVAFSSGVRDELKPVLAEFDGTAEEFAALAQALVALDDQAGGLSANLLTLIQNASGTGEEIIRLSSALVSIEAQSGVNTVARAIEEFTKTQDTAARSYELHTTSLREQIASFDGSVSAAEMLNQTLLENKTAAYEFAISIQTIGQALSEMAADQANSIRESILSPDALRKKRLAERDALNATLSTLADPELVSQTSKKILELNRQIYDSLSEDQQKVQAESFAQFAENTNQVAQGILQQSLDGLKITQDDINARVSQMLTQAAQGQQKAADTSLQAANDFGRYVEQLQRDGITITVQSGETSQVAA